jgi:DNA-binding NarL/FixJ family response regulator
MPYKILVVDDSEPIRIRLCSLLAGIPGTSTIDQAGTLSEALARVRLCPPELVILDLHLPDGLGLEIIASLKHTNPGLRVAILTLFGYSNYRQRCLTLGADWFFDKACQFDDLLDVVRQQVDLYLAANPEKSLT